MRETKYNKLVRDCIPEIIKADGKTCVCETLSDEDYLRLLDAKLTEELSEYQESHSLEELAERGGFEKKILLKEVREN